MRTILPASILFLVAASAASAQYDLSVIGAARDFNTPEDDWVFVDIDIDNGTVTELSRISESELDFGIKGFAALSDGTVLIVGPGNYFHNLINIDPATGAVLDILPLWSNSNLYRVTWVSDGLAVDPTDGDTVYGIVDVDDGVGFQTDYRLVTIDRQTGEVVPTPAEPLGFETVSLEADPCGELFSMRWPGANYNASRYLLDPNGSAASSNENLIQQQYSIAFPRPGIMVTGGMWMVRLWNRLHTRIYDPLDFKDETGISVVAITCIPPPAGASLAPGDCDFVLACGKADLTTTSANPGDPQWAIPDAVVNGADLGLFVELWLAYNPGADTTTTNTNPGDPDFGAPDGIINGADLSQYVELWLAGCVAP